MRRRRQRIPKPRRNSQKERLNNRRKFKLYKNATRAARTLIKEYQDEVGVFDLTLVPRSGSNDNITKKDVQDFIESRTSPGSSHPPKEEE